MRNKYKVYIFLMVALAVFSMVGCGKKGERGALTNPEAQGEGESLSSLSPDGKYRGEAYGTMTGITAGGLEAYEGIRIVTVENGDVIWELESGGYTVSFTWSPDGKYAAVYYTGRTWGESVVVDLGEKKTIPLPTFDEIIEHYGDRAKPQEDRNDPYFEITGWQDAETVIVDFQWTKADGDSFKGQYTYNINTKAITYQG